MVPDSCFGVTRKTTRISPGLRPASPISSLVVKSMGPSGINLMLFEFFGLRQRIWRPKQSTQVLVYLTELIQITRLWSFKNGEPRSHLRGVRAIRKEVMERAVISQVLGPSGRAVKAKSGTARFLHQFLHQSQNVSKRTAAKKFTTASSKSHLWPGNLARWQ